MHIPGLCGIEITGEEPREFSPLEFQKLGNMGSNGLRNIGLRTMVESGLLPVHVDGKKNVSRIRVKRGGASISMGLRKEEGSNVGFVVYPENHIRLLSLTSEQITMWETAVVSQQGNFFLTFQETVNIALKEGIGGILYGVGPQLQKWPQMKSFLGSLLGRRLLMLPEENPQEVRPWRVIWYNLAQGLGAIQTPKGAARVHWSQVAPRKHGFRYLQRGERGECNIVPMVQKPGARPTAFQWEALNVTPR
ncbi:MAG: hypothetical protein Q8P55_00105 [bacterium]|nr:hypothetical protein [bacterium]